MDVASLSCTVGCSVGVAGFLCDKHLYFRFTAICLRLAVDIQLRNKHLSLPVAAWLQTLRPFSGYLQ